MAGRQQGTRWPSETHDGHLHTRCSVRSGTREDTLLPVFGQVLVLVGQPVASASCDPALFRQLETRAESRVPAGPPEAEGLPRWGPEGWALRTFCPADGQGWGPGSVGRGGPCCWQAVHWGRGWAWCIGRAGGTGGWRTLSAPGRQCGHQSGCGVVHELSPPLTQWAPGAAAAPGPAGTLGGCRVSALSPDPGMGWEGVCHF